MITEVFFEIVEHNINSTKNKRRRKISFLINNYLLNCEIIICRILITAVVITSVVRAAPRAKTNNINWPPLVHHDIWSDEKLKDDFKFETEPFTHQNLNENVEDASNPFFMDFAFNATTTTDMLNTSRRESKVIHLFPVPVDGECLADDGRRTGSCLNAYECRNKGGQAKGDCALGFGVCCIFMADCNVTISNNITYLVSPGFPSFMPNNVTNCNLKIRILNDDIGQLRFDFNHFVLGQPNRRTGVCDGDVFEVSGGPGGTFSLCGQNSGQHMYYDVGGRMLPRHTLYGSLKPLRYEDLYPGRNNTNDSTMEIDLNLNFAARYLPIRLWEIRITQIPFSQRAPAGCLQYFTGAEGIFQTYNFADNGRHLANQHYRICMRQEMDMCSIIYQPCDEQSFRIGPSFSSGMGPSNNGQTDGIAGGISNPQVSSLSGMGPGNNGQFSGITQMDTTNNRPSMDQVLADDSAAMQMGISTSAATTSTITAGNIQETTATTADGASSSTTTVTNPTPTVSQTSSMSSTAIDTTGDQGQSSSMVTSTTASTTSASSSTPLSDDVEGSGGDDDGNIRIRPTPGSSNVSRRPRPTRGGFDLLGFLRSAFDLGFRSGRQVISLNERQKRQFYSSCRDRITMPCIVEDFIDTGLGPLPGCEPVHCGMQFCSNGIWPCRIESTVTPFYVSIHFGDGTGKGSAEDNIGACLKYQQVQCT